MTATGGAPTSTGLTPRASLVVLGAPSTGNAWVEQAASAASRLDGRWEVLLVTDEATRPIDGGATVSVVASSGGSLWEAMNDGSRAATGAHVVFIGPEQIPDPTTAALILTELDSHADADVVVFDEAASGVRPAFVKPTFSPERLRTQEYWGAFVAYGRGLLSTIGAGREAARGAEGYDLALRASRASRSIATSRLQLPSSDRPLESHWYADEAERRDGVGRVLEAHLAATGGGTVERIGPDGVHRTRRPVTGAPLVSIVIPTGGTSAEVRGRQRVMVVEAVSGILDRSTYTNIEFVLVVDATTPPGVRDDLRSLAGERATFVEWSEPFSFSGKMNLGVLHARGEYVLLLNDDVELITPDWIESMLALAQLPRAGTVGAMLYFDDDTIQHAGHAYYKLDVTHIGLNSERGASGPFGGFLVEREVAGNTAACSMMRRDVFLEAGGFSTLLPGNFNDVDLCMKVMTLGYQSYWTPFAELYHFESKSRDPRVAASEIRTAWGRWEHLFYDSDLWPTDPHEVFTRTG